MSTEDIKIQTSSPDELAGGQQSLEPDRTSTHGHNGNVVFPLSGKQGVNVEPGTAGPIAAAPSNREAASVSGMAVAAPLGVSVKQVDHRAIQGSNAPNDFRVHGDYAKASLDKTADNGGPRQPVGQFPLSGRTPAAPAPQSFDSENVGS